MYLLRHHGNFCVVLKVLPSVWLNLKNIETDSQIFLNFLYGIRGILPEININLPCSFPPGASQTWWNLTIGFSGKYLTFLSN